MNLDRTVTNLPAVALSLCIGSSRASLPIIVANQGIYGSHHKNYKNHRGDYYFEAGHSGYTLPETNSEEKTLKIGRHPKGKSSFNHRFSGAMLVSGMA